MSATKTEVGEAYLARGVHVVGYSVLLERLHRAVVGAFTDVVGAWKGRALISTRQEHNTARELGSGKDIPVPHESILETRPLYSGFLAIDWKTPSAIVERQMLPRQTKRTEIWSDILAGITEFNALAEG